MLIHTSHVYDRPSEMGTEPDPESGYIFGTGYKFSEKIRIRIRYYIIRLLWYYDIRYYMHIKCKVHVCKSMAEMVTEPDSSNT